MAHTTTTEIPSGVQQLLSQLHDRAADVVKLIDSIPLLRGNDLPEILARTAALTELKNLEAEYTEAEKPIPTNDFLKARVRLLRAASNAEKETDWRYHGWTNRQLATRIDILDRLKKARSLDDIGSADVDQLIQELQAICRRRRAEAKLEAKRVPLLRVVYDGNGDSEAEQAA